MPGMEEFAQRLPANEEELRELLQAQARHYEALLAEREGELEQRDETIERLREQVNVLLAKRYGASSEKVTDAQLGLFNEAELEAAAADEPEPEPDTTPVAPHRRSKPKRTKLPEYLPRITIEHPLPESERFCPHLSLIHI